MLPKSSLLPLTQFSSLENPKFGLTVEISFHYLFLTFNIDLLVATVLYIFCPCQAQFYTFGTL